MQREKNRRHEHFNNDDNKYPTLILYRINKNKSLFIKMAVNCIHFDIQNCIPQIFICLLTSSYLFINLNTLFLCFERQNWTKKLASKIIRAKIPIEVDAKQNYRKEHTYTPRNETKHCKKSTHIWNESFCGVFLFCNFFKLHCIFIRVSLLINIRTHTQWARKTHRNLTLLLMLTQSNRPKSSYTASTLPFHAMLNMFILSVCLFLFPNHFISFTVWLLRLAMCVSECHNTIASYHACCVLSANVLVNVQNVCLIRSHLVSLFILYYNIVIKCT